MRISLTLLLLFTIPLAASSQCAVEQGTSKDNIKKFSKLSEITTVTDSLKKLDVLMRKAVSDYSVIYNIKTPTIYYTDSLNAFADPSDSTMIMGAPFMQYVLKDPNPYTYMAFVVAHEMSHLYQFQHNYSKNPFGKEKTYKHLELQADYMASYLYFTTYSVSEKVNQNWLEVLVDCADGLGDLLFTDSTHHGSGAERERMVRMGSSVMHVEADTVFKRSFKIVHPSQGIKILDEKKIIGEITFNTGEKYYISYDNEVYIAQDNEYKQIGTMRGDDKELGTSYLELKTPRSNRIPIKYKVALLKVYNSDNEIIGRYELRPGIFSKN